MVKNLAICIMGASGMNRDRKKLLRLKYNRVLARNRRVIPCWRLKSKIRFLVVQYLYDKYWIKVAC